VTLLAELELRHSRPVAPTRRLALGLWLLPVEPPACWAGVLLGGIVAANLGAIDPDLFGGVQALVDDLEAGRVIEQPRLRHRLQRDVVGLDRSRHSLVGDGDQVWFDLDSRARPEVNVLGALYAAGELGTGELGAGRRTVVFRMIRKSMRWNGPWSGDGTAAFISYLLGAELPSSPRNRAPDVPWALRVLGFRADAAPTRDDVLMHFRDAVWVAHPDRGGDLADASTRMTELLRARKILAP
jgi:hypothetical protein